MYGLEWYLNRFLDVVVPPLGFVVLLFWAPVTAALDALLRWYNWLRAPSMENKVVLITGASSGIGEHLAYEFAKRGARLVLAGLRGERLRRVGQECEHKGAEDYVTVEGDTAYELDCRRMVETAINRFGQLDVLVNNAGVATGDLFKDVQSVDALRRVIDVNYFGYVWITLHALPYLRRTQGRILVNASVAAFTPMPRHNIYGASKSAVVQFFDTLRTEPVGRDVSITTAFPGATASEMTAGKVIDEYGNMTVDQDKRDNMIGPQPMMRTATVAQRMVSALLARAHYTVVPFWFSLALLFRVFVPELLQLSLAWQLLPWMRGASAPHKMFMDNVMGPKVLYHAPATSQKEAEAAVYEGARPEQDQSTGIVEKAVKGMKEMVMPQKASSPTHTATRPIRA